MKRGFMKSMLFSSVMLLAMGLWSCSDDKVDSEKNFNAENAVVSIVSDPNTVFTASVDLTLNVSGVESYAYYIAEGEDVQEPLGEIIYRNATQEGGSGIVSVPTEGGEVPVSIYGLEGGKTYTIFFAFKAGEDYVVKSQVITTKAYSKLLTVISADKYKVKFHVSAGNDTTYRVGLIPAETYYASLLQMRSEVDLLNNGGILVKNDTTIELSDGQPVDPSNLDNGSYVIKPGSSYILMVAQCLMGDGLVMGRTDYELPEGSEDNGGGVMPWSASRSMKPDVENDYEWNCSMSSDGSFVGDPYTSETLLSDGYLMKTTIPGRVAKLNLYTEAFTQVPSQMTITELTMNERTAKFSFVMGEGVIQYAATILTETDYNQMVEWVGEKGKIGYLLSSGLMQVASEPQELSISPMNDTTTYKLITIAAYDTDFNTISYDEQDFNVVKSDLPAPTIEVTPVEQDTLYAVGFNLRCPSGNCTSFKYAVQDASEWENLKNPEQGVTDKGLIETYGSIVTDPTVIAAINSPEGFTMVFQSNEDVATKFGAFLMNEDEKISEVKTASCYAKPAYGENPIESELFEKLKGTWTATYTYYLVGASQPRETTFEMNISDSPETISYNTWQDFKAAELDNYLNVLNSRMRLFGETEDEANENITADIAEFKAEVASNAKKYRSNNRLVMTQFKVTSSYFPYASAWDLYSNPNYVSYDLKELFYDYGPKLFLEVAKTADGKDSLFVNINSDLKGVPPMSAWQAYTYFMMIYNQENKAYLMPNALPVTLSEDNDTITIGGYRVQMEDGTYLDYQPTPGYISPIYNTPMFNFGGVSNIVLTRTASAGPTPSRYYADNDVKSAKITPFRTDGTMRATRFPKVIKPKKKVTMAPVSLMDYMKSKVNK